MKERRRRLAFMTCLSLLILGGVSFASFHQASPAAPLTPTVQTITTARADATLQDLPVKGRAPKTGYTRAQFGEGWQPAGNCDVRNAVLARDLVEEALRSETDCTVLSGVLHDPYTGKTISFARGPGSSNKVQIDHVVALSDAWQKGAQQLTFELRATLANDPLNLLAVDGAANQAKSDSDAASWLPPNKEYRCRYVARQIAVKGKYHLWVTSAERAAMQRVLVNCPEQRLPMSESPGILTNNR